MKNCTLAAIAAFILSACNTPDTAEVPVGTREFTRDATTGTSRSDTGTDELQVAAVGAYLGDATNRTVRAQVTRATSATRSGDIQQAFALGTSPATVDAVGAAMERDPVLAVLRAQIEAEQAKAEPDAARLDALTAQMSARVEALEKSLVKMGGDLGGLKVLVVTNVHRSPTGAPPDQPSDAEVQAAATAIPSAIQAGVGGGDQ